MICMITKFVQERKRRNVEAVWKDVLNLWDMRLYRNAEMPLSKNTQITFVGDDVGIVPQHTNEYAINYVLRIICKTEIILLKKLPKAHTVAKPNRNEKIISVFMRVCNTSYCRAGACSCRICMGRCPHRPVCQR